jgi:hypothetical protein
MRSQDNGDEEGRLLVMATKLLHDLMERSSELNQEEKERLARFLSEQVRNSDGNDEGTAPQSPHTEPSKGQHATTWLKAHATEYAGQYVALNGDQLVGSGPTIRHAHMAAKRNGCPQAFLVHVPPRQGYTWGGWS